jgi:hypothetical protein
MFIAVVGISAGPGFVQGFHDVGISLFLVGAAATTFPLIIGLLLARYLFKFHPASPARLTEEGSDVLPVPTSKEPLGITTPSTT